jgi:hypothetical protein
LKWRIAIDTYDAASSQQDFDGEHDDSGAAPRTEVSRRTMGKLIGVAAAGAAAAGALGALPAEAQESRAAARVRTYRLFPHTNGPRTPASYTGSFLAGVAFEATTGGCWLEGFWWWVCDRRQSTKAQKFALWQGYGIDDGNLQGKLIGGTTAEAKRLHAGRWNYIALHRPVPLAIGATYVAATGLKGSFPITKHSFGKHEKYHAGITNGPLRAYSDVSGSYPLPFGASQALFSVASDDPTKHMPGLGDGQSSNFWMDLQVTTTAPKGTSYRLWPNFPIIPAGDAADLDQSQQSFGTEFWLSERCKLDRIWFYTPPGATVLPGACAIFDVGTHAMVPGTLKTSPRWSGKAASGWVSSSYSGITLPAGKYKTSVWSEGGQPFFTELPFYFGSSLATGKAGPASASGIANGPIYSPNLAKASPAESNGTYGVTLGSLHPSNSTYQNNDTSAGGNAGQFLYPYTFDSKDHGETRWVDVEVTPI